MGGAVYVQLSSNGGIGLANDLFEGCKAFGSGYNGFGGGVYILVSDSVTPEFYVKVWYCHLLFLSRLLI
jgi:hypothetical protein